MGSGYHLAFDLGREGNLFGLWPLLILPTVAAFTLIIRAIFGDRKQPYRWLIITGCVLVVVIVIAVYFGKGQRLRVAEAAGYAITQEGCLRHFHPESRGGSEGEQLDLNGVTIRYSFDDETPAFHQTETHGGPIHRDSKIKVTTVLDQIIRLETRDHACPPAPDIVANGAE